MPQDNFRVDTHAHIFTTSLALAPGHRHAPQYDATLQNYLQLLDKHGIRYGVLTAPSFLGTDNSHLLQGLAAANGRLRGTVIVDPRTPRSSLEKFATQGVIGIRLNLFRKTDPPDLSSAEYRRLFETCAALDWQVEIYDEGPRLARWLPQIMATSVKVVVDHFGSPDPATGVECAGFQYILKQFATGRLWVKLSARYRVGNALAAACAKVLLQEGTAKRLVWGSDWPWTQNESGQTYAECLHWLEEWIPEAKDREIMLGATARQLFHFPEPH
jgi:predicted TIM-barrel fold metal-dependent hydrolase